MKHPVISFSLITASLLLPSIATADTRSGFYLSGGLGITSVYIDVVESGVVYSDSQFRGFDTAFKIGGYINPNLALYYHREAAWFNDDDGEEWIGGLSGIGGSYYFEPENGAYLEFALGFSDLGPADYDTSFTSSSAFLLGAGVEVTDHLQLGAYFMSSTTQDPHYPSISYEQKTVGAKLELKL